MRLLIPVTNPPVRLHRLAVPLLLLGLAACSSDRGAPANISVKDTPVVPTAMLARGKFFAGKVEAEALLGAGVGFGHGRREGGRRGFFGRGRGGGGGGGGGEGIVVVRDGVFDEDTNDEPVYYAVPGSTLPPVQLRLRLTNTGTESVQVDILDFNSSLGNFSVQPPKLMLAPGEAREVEPMTSRLGVTADEIPITIRLRINAEIDRQVLKMQLVKTVPKPAAGTPADVPAPPAKAP